MEEKSLETRNQGKGVPGKLERGNERRVSFRMRSRYSDRKVLDEGMSHLLGD